MSEGCIVPDAFATIANTPYGASWTTKVVMRDSAAETDDRISSSACFRLMPISATPRAILNTTIAGTIGADMALKGLDGMNSVRKSNPWSLCTRLLLKNDAEGQSG